MKKLISILRLIGLIILGLFTIVFYFFKWLFTWLYQKTIIWIRNTKWARKVGKVILIILEILYLPVYYAVYAISIVLRFFTCICYVLMFNPRRAWYAFKLILK